MFYIDRYHKKYILHPWHDILPFTWINKARSYVAITWIEVSHRIY